MSIYVERSKTRRILETEFRNLNKYFKNILPKDDWLRFNFSTHIIDRIIQRDLSIQQVIRLMYNLEEKVQEVLDYCHLPPLPAPGEKLEDIEYRPVRLEITDGKLWLGFTVSPYEKSPYKLNLRMGFFNPNRLPSKVSTKLIKVKE